MNRFHPPKAETRSYLAVHCENCGSPIPFAIDHTAGERENPPAAKLVLTCAGATCRHRADYTAAAILRYQEVAAAKDEGTNNESREGRQRKG